MKIASDVNNTCICVTFMSNVQLSLSLELYVADSPPFLIASVTSQEQLKEGKGRLLCP